VTKLSPPEQGRARTADLTVHALGVPLGALAAIVLIALTVWVRADDPAALLSVPLYAAALVAMLAFSAAYNMALRPTRRAWLRRVDHATIYVMIAGTYTPFMLIDVGGRLGAIFTMFVWAVALLGAAVKLAWPHRFERLSIALYLLLGWSVLAVLRPLLSAVDTVSIVLLLGGGLVYTVGVPIYLAKHFTYHRAAWHACVLAAALLHYAAVLRTVLVGAGHAA